MKRRRLLNPGRHGSGVSRSPPSKEGGLPGGLFALAPCGRIAIGFKPHVHVDRGAAGGGDHGCRDEVRAVAGFGDRERCIGGISQRNIPVRTAAALFRQKGVVSALMTGQMIAASESAPERRDSTSRALAIFKLLETRRPYPRSRGRRLSRTQRAAVGKLSASASSVKIVSTADTPAAPTFAQSTMNDLRRLARSGWHLRNLWISVMVTLLAGRFTQYAQYLWLRV